MTWKVGSGERIKFWTDRWLGADYTLEQKYNQLFQISRQQSSFISSMGKDCMVWLAEPHGHYTTKSAYNFYTIPSTANWYGNIYKKIWKLKIPPRASVFCWRLLKNRLPTKDNLLRRNINIQDQNCPLCGNAQEDVGHLFFNCNLTKGLWWES